jgi:hypothetical protein
MQIDFSSTEGMNQFRSEAQEWMVVRRLAGKYWYGIKIVGVDRVREFDLSLLCAWIQIDIPSPKV